MALALGFKPDTLTVYLSRFGDFVAALVYDDGDPATANVWPAGTSIELKFYATKETTIVGANWPATIAADRASWSVPKATIASAVLDPGNDVARLIYTTPAGVELEWDIGQVRDVR